MKKHHKYSGILLLLTALSGMSSCIPDKPAEAFGFSAPGDSAVIFGEGLFSEKDRYEFAVTMSPDAERILFTVNKGEGEPYYLLCADFENGQWSSPRKVQLSKGAYPGEMEAFYTPDGQYLYFTAFDTARYNILRIPAEDFENQVAEVLPGNINDGIVFYPTTSSEHVLYYTNVLKRKVFRAVEQADSFRVEACVLDLTGHVFIAPGEDFILMDGIADKESRNRDIFLVPRNPDGSWGHYINLGSGINSAYPESCPSLSPCGKYIFFSRYNDENEKSDLYWISSSILDKYLKE